MRQTRKRHLSNLHGTTVLVDLQGRFVSTDFYLYQPIFIEQPISVGQGMVYKKEIFVKKMEGR